MSNTPGVYGIDDVVSAYYAQGQDKNGNNESENNNNNNNDSETNNNSSLPEPENEHQFIQSYNDNEELKAGWKTLPYYLTLTLKQSPLYDDFQYFTIVDSDIEKAYDAYKAGIPIVISILSDKLMIKDFIKYKSDEEEYHSYFLVGENMTYIDEDIYSGPSTMRFDIEVAYDANHNDWIVNINQENSYATRIVSLTEADYLERAANAQIDPHTLYCIIEEENSDSGNDGGK